MDNEKEEIILEKIERYYKNYGTKRTKLNFEDDILKLNSPNLSYWFAKNIEGSNIKAHEQIVLESKNPKWCYKFARDVKGSDIDSLEHASHEASEHDYDFESLKTPKYLQEEKDIEDIKHLVKTSKK